MLLLSAVRCHLASARPRLLARLIGVPDYGTVFDGGGLEMRDNLGLILGAFFMATDYVTCPSIRKGQIIFGIGCGAITMLIRLKGGFPEGVMFAILLMNCFAPLIDRQFKPVMFGAVKEKKEQEK